MSSENRALAGSSKQSCLLDSEGWWVVVERGGCSLILVKTGLSDRRTCTSVEALKELLEQETGHLLPVSAGSLSELKMYFVYPVINLDPNVYI